MVDQRRVTMPQNPRRMCPESDEDLMVITWQAGGFDGTLVHDWEAVYNAMRAKGWQFSPAEIKLRWDAAIFPQVLEARVNAAKYAENERTNANAGNNSFTSVIDKEFDFENDEDDYTHSLTPYALNIIMKFAKKNEDASLQPRQEEKPYAGPLLQPDVYVPPDSEKPFTRGYKHLYPKPGNVQPGSTQPGIAKPATVEPVASEPPTTESVATEPVAAEPVTTEAVATESPTTEPVTTESVAAEYVAIEPVTTEPIPIDALAKAGVAPEIITAVMEANNAHSINASTNAYIGINIGPVKYNSAIVNALLKAGVVTNAKSYAETYKDLETTQETHMEKHDEMHLSELSTDHGPEQDDSFTFIDLPSDDNLATDEKATTLDNDVDEEDGRGIIREKADQTLRKPKHDSDPAAATTFSNASDTSSVVASCVVLVDANGPSSASVAEDASDTARASSPTLGDFASGSFTDDSGSSYEEYEPEDEESPEEQQTHSPSSRRTYDSDPPITTEQRMGDHRSRTDSLRSNTALAPLLEEEDKSSL